MRAIFQNNRASTTNECIGQREYTLRHKIVMMIKTGMTKNDREGRNSYGGYVGISEYM